MLDKTIGRTKSDFMKNEGQSIVDASFREWIDKIPDIDRVEDLWKVNYAIFNYLKLDNSVEGQIDKFSSSASEIFRRGTYTGCSDIGIFSASILREKGIPTVYVESADSKWLEDIKAGVDNDMRGHIMLEIFMKNEWLLYDPTLHRVYYRYNKNNSNLPMGLVAFSKGLNSADVGVYNEHDERHSALTQIDLKTFSYTDPNYTWDDVRNFRKQYINNLTPRRQKQFSGSISLIRGVFAGLINHQNKNSSGKSK